MGFEVVLKIWSTGEDHGQRLHERRMFIESFGASDKERIKAIQFPKEKVVKSSETSIPTNNNNNISRTIKNFI